MKILHDLALIIMGCAFGMAVFGSIQSWQPEPEPIVITEYRTIEAEPEIIYETVYVPYEEPFYRNLTKEDEEALLDISMREASGESVIGQAMVMLVVINRAETYGKPIKEIVESDAFKSSRSMSGQTPNENCLKALELIREGWTPKPLYFRANQYHSFGTPLYQVGTHYFSA